jgi:hypothetical protein
MGGGSSATKLPQRLAKYAPNKMTDVSFGFGPQYEKLRKQVRELRDSDITARDKEALKKIDTLLEDPIFKQRFLSGDVATQDAAKEDLRMAFPEAFQKLF